MIHINSNEVSSLNGQSSAEQASPKMDSVLKAKWVEALRSGEYTQGVQRLHNPKTDSYCCLGVLCKVLGAEFGKATEDGDEEFGPSSFDYVPHIGGEILSSGEDEELKARFCKKVGIPEQSELITLNDGMGHQHPSKSFAEIADFIEANL